MAIYLCKWAQRRTPNNTITKKPTYIRDDDDDHKDDNNNNNKKIKKGLFGWMLQMHLAPNAKRDKRT